MSRRLAALVCGIFALPALVSTPLLAEAAPVDATRTGAAAPAQKRSLSTTPRIARPATTTPTAAPVKKAVFSSRVVAGSADVTDGSKRTWTRRPAGLGSWKSGTTPTTTDIAGTKDDVLYRKTAPGVRWYRVNVPAKATYKVRLLMQENYFSRPGQRVFDVRAEGRAVRSNIDIAKAVGKNAAYDVTFSVPVVDGRLDIDFVGKVDHAIVSAVEVVSTGPVALPAAPRPKVAISPNSFYLTDISSAPLATNSKAASKHLLAQVTNNWGGVAAFNAYRYNNSFYEVGPKQPKVRVNFYDCQRKGHTPGGLFTGAKHFVDVPIPADAVPATGTDKQLTIYDRTADKLWDFWVTEKQANGSWRACWGGRIDDVSTNQGIFPGAFGATATGLAMTPGVISLEEFRRGRIDHAMYLAIIEPARWPNFSWPANRTDGHSTDPNALAEGQRIRVDPELDLTTIPMTPVARMVAEAAQKYGFVVTDRAGAVAVVTESGNAEKARTGKNPWDGMLAGPDYQALQGFPWEHIQVLPKNYGKPTK